MRESGILRIRASRCKGRGWFGKLIFFSAVCMVGVLNKRDL